MASSPFFVSEGDEPDLPPELERRVVAEEVATVYATLRGAVFAGVTLAAVMAAYFFLHLGSTSAIVWFAIFAAGKLRYPRVGAYYADAAPARRSVYWSRSVTRDLCVTSVIWGLAPWLLLPDGDVPLASVLSLILLTLASGGMLAVAPVRGAIYAHAVPMTAGLATALAWRGNGTELLLAGCCVLYLVVTLGFALRQHSLIRRAIVARFAKEDLAVQLEQQVAIARRASEEKNRFLAAASHDLRQPLHAIALFGAVLDKELRGGPQEHNAQRLMEAVGALGDSLDTMLDVSRLDAGVIEPEPRDVPLDSLLQSLYALFDRRAEQKGLHLRLRASQLAVHTDPDLLRRLLANLIENAIKYTERGGVFVGARRRGDEVWIECWDTGIGIPADHLPRIFDEFYQVGNPARDRSRGLGIGLSIVRRVAALLGHRIEVKTVPGRGTRFRVIVPRSGAASTSGTITSAVRGPTDLPRRVLVLDDEEVVGHAVAALLDAHGIVVRVCRNEHEAAAALHGAEAAGQPFEALLCDYRLAEGGDGVQAALRLRHRAQAAGTALPVLLVTGETSPERLQQVRDSGMPVLYKPASAPALLDALAALRAQAC
jgi:signal transduction histidine kinase/CheY-like chemotaxis protein